MVSQKLIVMVVGQPGRERDALRVMLTSFRQVYLMTVLDGFTGFAENLNQTHPDAVIIKIKTFEHRHLLYLQAMRQMYLFTRYLVIADTINQCRALTSIGMDQVFMTGFTNIELNQTLHLWSSEKMSGGYHRKWPLFPLKVQKDGVYK